LDFGEFSLANTKAAMSLKVSLSLYYYYTMVGKQAVYISQINKAAQRKYCWKILLIKKAN